MSAFYLSKNKNGWSLSTHSTFSSLGHSKLSCFLLHFAYDYDFYRSKIISNNSDEVIITIMHEIHKNFEKVGIKYLTKE